MLHQFDNFGELSATPWKVHAPPGQGFLNDRLSASLVNSQVRKLFDGGPHKGGFVMSPTHNSVLCSWAVDAGTMSRTCHPPGPSKTCIPGCSGGEGWCEDNPNSGYCPWGPSHLHEMVRQQLADPGNHGGQGLRYNEVILDAFVWERNLPDSIEAVYFTNGDEVTARNVHRKIVDHFMLPPTGIPLLRLELGGTQPFEVVPV